MNVVVFTKRVPFKTLLEFECKEVIGFAPIIKESFEELKSFLALDPDVEILIIDGSTDEIFETFSLSTHVKNILVLSNQESKLNRYQVFNEDEVEALVTKMKEILKPNSKNHEGYISIPVDSLVHFNILPFDLFLKVGEKYLKRIPANEPIDESLVHAFLDKGLKEIYFERIYNRDFSLMLLNNMINKVESDYSTASAKLKASNEVFLTTKEIVRSVGLPPKVIQVCESVMERIITDVTTQKNKLASYISGVKSTENLNFQFRFIELTSFIATQIVDLMNESNKDEQIKTIVFASFFCDISLSESNQLSYRSEDSLKDLWEEDRKSVNNHALKASEIVMKYKNAPSLAGEVIKQHHGSLDGKGFPKLISPSLLPLAKCLIAAQELALGILLNPNSPASEVVHEITNKFEGSTIQEYMKIFGRSCGENAS